MCSINPPSRWGSRYCSRKACEKLENTKHTHTRINAGGGSVVERWGTDAIVVRVRTDQRAGRPGAALVCDLASKEGGESGSLAYVSRLLPALVLGKRARVRGSVQNKQKRLDLRRRIRYEARACHFPPSVARRPVI